MASTLHLVERDDLIADVAVLDLRASGIETVLYESAAGDPNGPDLAETATLNLSSTTHNGVATIVQGLDAKIIKANNYITGKARYGIWLRHKLNNESNARQSLITLARPDPDIKLDGLFLRHDTILGPYVLGLERRPWWEATAYSEIGDEDVSLLGGKVSYADLPGEIPARLSYVSISSTDGLGEVWAGFRSSEFGNPANFVPVWNLRKAADFATGTTGGTANADATAQDGYKVVTTFSTTTLIERLRMRLAEATATNRDDQRGRFQVLLRAKCTSTLVARVRLGGGWYANVSMAFNDTVPVSGTAWKLYDLGQIEIPSPANFSYGVGELDYYTLRLDAEVESGSGNLEMDCLVLIPLEGYIHTSSASSFGALAAQHKANDERLIRTALTGGGYLFTPTQIEEGAPPGTGCLVIAGQRTTAQTLADVALVVAYVYPRWLALRGAS